MNVVMAFNSIRYHCSTENRYTKAMRIIPWLSERPEWVRVIGLATLAALFYACFSIGLPQRYNSPDEAANAFFARRIGSGETIAAPSPLNALAGEPLIHPRSTRIVERKLVPASFLGFSLIAGAIARAFGNWILPIISALSAILGLTAAFYCVKRLSNSKVALFSIVLLTFLPPYWYYHARGYFHNAMFFDLLLASAWVAICALQEKRPRYYAVAGFIAGLALTTRTSEIFWVLGGAAIVAAMSWRDIKLKYLGLTALGAIVGFLPVLFTNFEIYGRFFSVGYRPDLILGDANLARATSLFAELVLPFGFNPEVIGSTTRNYLWQLFPVWALFASIGLVFILFRIKHSSAISRRVLIAGCAASVWLIVLYGSWQFNDNPDPLAVTLGTSYARYWLPLYAFFLWPAGEAMAFLWSKHWGKAVATALTVSYVLLSIVFTVFEPQEGLLQISRNVRRFEFTSLEVRRVTEPDSIVVTDWITDKLFWPNREVLVSEEPVQHLAAIRKLLEAGKKVYRFHPTWSAKDLAYLNNRRLKLDGLKVGPVLQGLDGYGLYRFELR